jgi:enoyl-CoA hydratase/carnithine racemase
VEGALQRPLPSRDDLRAAAAMPVLTDEVLLPTQFSAEEAQRVGLVQESAVDWAGKVEAEDEVATEAESAAESTLSLPGLPASTEAPEPTEGRALAEHVQVGFAYQMNLEGTWHKVRLAHVSAARSFFIFTHGGRHRKTISLTQRMLARLCEAGRLRAFERATLIERATARARRQLAALGGAQAAGG